MDLAVQTGPGVPGCTLCPAMPPLLAVQHGRLELELGLLEPVCQGWLAGASPLDESLGGMPVPSSSCIAYPPLCPAGHRARESGEGALLPTGTPTPTALHMLPPPPVAAGFQRVLTGKHLAFWPQTSCTEGGP